ncbi:AsmA family protein [bacterium]|nr:AsmA family protein [bacterium]
MKRFLKFFGFTILAITIILYLCFLFVLPNAIDLNQYKGLLKQIVREQADLDLDFGEVKITTTPLLSAGIKTTDITLKYEDGEEILTADSLKARISLPSLILYTIKVSCLEIENPKINLSINDGKNLKIIEHFDKIIDKNSKNIGQEKNPDVKPAFDASKIRIKVPNAKLRNYNVTAVDTKNEHNLILKGDELNLGYFNGKTAKVKTTAEILSDDNTNIIAKLNIDTFLPPPNKLDEEDDKVQRAELPYANIVEIYRTYDLKTFIDSKLKIRKNNNQYKITGHLNIDDLTLKLANYTLPKSYAHLKFMGQKVYSDSYISIENSQNIKLLGLIDYSEKPRINIVLNSDKIYFNSLVNFAKGVMDTFRIKNNLENVNADGYIFAKAKIDTNFKKLKSDGIIYIRNGKYQNIKTGLNIKKTNSDIILDNNLLKIKDTNIDIDNTPVKIQGEIGEKSIADIKIKTEKLPLKNIYKTFAPIDLKNSYSVNSGELTLDINLTGELKKAVLTFNAIIDNFGLSDKAKSIIVSDGKLKTDFTFTPKEMKGNITNSDLSIFLPSSKSNLKNKELKIDIDSENIVISPAKLILNNSSEVTFSASINEWKKDSLINALANGKLNAQDIKQLAGKDAAMFIDAKGIIPLKLTYDGDKNRQNLFLQIFTDKDNYVTPFNIDSIYGKPASLQTKIAFKENRLKVKETGLFERISSIDEKTGETTTKLNEIIGIEGTITHLKTEPFINLLTINIPKELKLSLNGFKKADFNLSGKLHVFGKTSIPRFKGGFYIKNLQIEDLLSSIEKVNIDFIDRQLNIDIVNMLLNNSDLNIKFQSKLIPSNTFSIENLDINSKDIDVDKVLTVIESLDKFTPKTTDSKTVSTDRNDIPVKITNGRINLAHLKTGNINVDDILSKLNFTQNTLYFNDMRVKAFDGNMSGDISINLLSSILHIDLGGENINAEKAALDCANLKDTIFGKLSFDTNLIMNTGAKNYNEQIKSIDGTVDFLIQNGSLGPFGKLENMILAENIRESEFFKTALGGIISNLTTIDTTHFENMNGHLIFKDGILHISPITSNGNVLNLWLAGDMDILKNTLDMKVRAKLGSEISNMLGPIAAINPINLVKATPGLNIVMAKTFILFCEEVTAEEMDIIPKFKDNQAEFFSTKFQIVLRGDVSKPLTLVKSFKWLVTSTELAAAEAFVESLPEPEVTSKGTVLQTPEEIDAYNKKLSTKLKKFFKKNKKDKKNE